jgi:hypothetical protein
MSKILNDKGETKAELDSVQLAGPVSKMGVDFVATGGDALMGLGMNHEKLVMQHDGKTYNCMVQNSSMASNAAGSGYAIRGKVWPRE